MTVADFSAAVNGLDTGGLPSARGTGGSVLLVTPWYRPSIGGVVEVADRLLRLLGDSGVETHLLVCDEHYRRRIVADPAIANVWRFRIPSSAFYRLTLKTVAGTLIRGALAFWRLLRFVLSRRVRTIVLIFPSSDSWPFLLLRHVARAHLVASCHGNDLLKYTEGSVLSRWILRRVLRGADAITVTADHLAAEARRLVPGRPLPIRLIPNCVDADHFGPPPAGFARRSAGPTLLHVSSFTPKKRTADIVEAFARAAIPANSRLVMVGAGVCLEGAIERARSLGVAHRVEFVGAHGDVRPFFWDADLLVMASDEESGPLALLEAMACGVAWVATAWGVAALLPPGECGVLVPCRSPERLAAAIGQLIADPERRHAMGLRGQYRARSEFGEDKYLERHLRLLEDVDRGALDQSGGRRRHP